MSFFLTAVNHRLLVNKTPLRVRASYSVVLLASQKLPSRKHGGTAYLGNPGFCNLYLLDKSKPKQAWKVGAPFAGKAT